MKLVLDASVAVAALRRQEISHRTATEFLRPLWRGEDQLIVPAIFRIEVASALARGGFQRSQIQRITEPLFRDAEEVTIGPKRANKIQRIAIETKLRASDAIYVWLASSRALPLVTSDREIAERASALCEVRVV